MLFKTDILRLLSVKGKCETVCQFLWCGMRNSNKYKRSRTYRNTATTVLCCRGCCSDDYQPCKSCLATDKYNQRSFAIDTEPHVFHTVSTLLDSCLFCKEFCSCRPYHYDCVTNGHGVCPIVIPCFHVPEAYA